MLSSKNRLLPPSLPVSAIAPKLRRMVRLKRSDSDCKDRLTKQEYPAGSHVLTVYWCDYGGLDMGPEAPDRVYKVGKEFPGYVFSHLVLCTLQTAPVMDSRGKRPLSGVFKVSQKELEVAIGLS